MREGTAEGEKPSETTRKGAALMVAMFLGPLLLLALWAAMSH